LKNQYGSGKRLQVKKNIITLNLYKRHIQNGNKNFSLTLGKMPNLITTNNDKKNRP
jgi:hypothetical protein